MRPYIICHMMASLDGRIDCDMTEQIAYRLGFEYPQHFSRLFKSRTGMTPNEFRLTA